MRLDNPVLNRELIEHLRSPKSFVLLALFISLLGGVVLLTWPAEVEVLKVQAKSQSIYDIFALGQIALIALLAPIVSAPAIAAERERRSIDMLLTSPLSAGDIISGKLIGAIAFLLMLSISSLPVFSICFMLGAISPWQVLATFVLIFSFSFTCGAIGITASTFLGRTRNALSASYVIILPLVVFIILLNPMRKINTLYTLAVVSVTLGVILIAVSIAKLKKPFDETPRPPEEEDKDEQVGLVLDRRRFLDRLLSPPGSGKPMDERINPVYQKELRHELFGQGTLLMRVLLQAALITSLPVFIASLLFQGLWIYTYYIIIFILLMTPSLCSGMFTQERERGTFDLLLTTSMERHRIIVGKLMVGLRNIGVLTGLLLFMTILTWVLCLARPSYYHTFVTIRLGWFNMIFGTLSVIGATALFTISLSAFFSMICRTTLRCMVYTFSVIGVFFLLPVIFYAILITQAGYSPEDARWVGVTSPFFTVASLERLSDRDLKPVLDKGGTIKDGIPIMHIKEGIGASQLTIFLMLTLGFSTLFTSLLYVLYNRYCQFRHDIGG